VQLSIIIVNYNVQAFLEQCLYAVRKAILKLEAEVFVVDNHSLDGSCEMVKKKFPEVYLIENKLNTGFSRANNQALKLATGKYVLLLNPDTVVQEESFTKILAFAETKPNLGGLGVKMIDGHGNFLPESKRALPTPMVSFYKIFGLAAAFPHSKTFNRYYLGHLDRNKNHEIEILSGAFMFMSRSALLKVGFLDEVFFMYGEDIDLSYRLLQANYKNYYFAETTIVHYKGESTKKFAFNYVQVFYKAMLIFYRKHFSHSSFRFFSFFIQAAIYLRASVSLAKRLVFRFLYPFLDALLLYFGIAAFIPVWATIKFHNPHAYAKVFEQYAIPAYVLIIIVSIWLSNAYTKPVRLKRHFKALLYGNLLVWIVYAFLPEAVRFSRFILLAGSLWSFVATYFVRFFLQKLLPQHFPFFLFKEKNILILAKQPEYQRITALLDASKKPYRLPAMPQFQYSGFSHEIETKSLRELLQIMQINEIIFSSEDLPTKLIISKMTELSTLNIDFKIAPPASVSLVGSSSIRFYSLRSSEINNSPNKLINKLLGLFQK